MNAHELLLVRAWDRGFAPAGLLQDDLSVHNAWQSGTAHPIRRGRVGSSSIHVVPRSSAPRINWLRPPPPPHCYGFGWTERAAASLSGCGAPAAGSAPGAPVIGDDNTPGTFATMNSACNAAYRS